MDDDPPGPAAETGKRFHALVDAELSGEEVPAIESDKADEEKAQKWLKRWREWWPTFSGEVRWRSEVAYLYDWASGEVEEQERGWAKGKRERRETQIPIILDLLAIDGNTATIYDWKTGKEVEPAAQNSQMLAAALAVAKRHPEVGEFKIGLIYTRIRDPFKVDEATVGLLDVLEFEASLKEKMASVPSSHPRWGPWCWKCNAKKVCPVMKRDDSEWWESWLKA